MGATMMTSAGAEAFRHQPVLATEVTELFAPVPEGLVVDGTLGGGGHAAALLSAHRHLRILGVDRDATAVAAATERLRRFGDRAEVVRARFDEVPRLLDERPGVPLVGALFDLARLFWGEDRELMPVPRVVEWLGEVGFMGARSFALTERSTCIVATKPGGEA